MKWHLSHYIVPFELLSWIFFSMIISSSFKLQNLSNVFQQLWAVTTCRDISVQLFFTDELSWTSEDSSETKEELLLSHVYKYSECVHENLLMSRNECHKKKKKKRQIWQNFIKMSKYLRIWPFWQIFAIFVNACISEHWMPVQTQLLNKPCQQKADPWNQVLQCSGSEHSLFSGLHS